LRGGDGGVDWDGRLRRVEGEMPRGLRTMVLAEGHGDGWRREAAARSAMEARKDYVGAQGGGARGSHADAGRNRALRAEPGGHVRDGMGRVRLWIGSPHASLRDRRVVVLGGEESSGGSGDVSGDGRSDGATMD